MNPQELRAAAERLDREVFTQIPLTPEQFDAAILAYRALTRLADVIEHADRVRRNNETCNCFECATAHGAATAVLRIARGES